MKLADKGQASKSAGEQLILACSRTAVSAEIAGEIRELAAKVADWGAVESIATEHGVMALLCGNLLTTCPEILPDEVRTRLREILENHARRNLFLAAELLRLGARFRGAGLLAIPYKGPVLAAQAYGDLGLRQFADLDFAIWQRDLPRALELLVECGYKPVFGSISPQEGNRPTHSEYQFVRPQGNVIVEMQTETTLRYFPAPLDIAALAARRRHVSFAGGAVEALSPEDTLILLSVHGAKHFWGRLLWICDIAELAQLSGGMNWSEAFARAREMQVGRVVRVALAVAERLLGTPLPPE
ncbi:MAG: nucleotidyltransferase domain-containing protein, partial [Bryobacteraceae bacterium]